jgi:glutathione-regulated potassium-efflux system ancillary protein KefF
VPESDRPAENDEVGKVVSNAFRAAMAHGLASTIASADNDEKAA